MRIRHHSGLFVRIGIMALLVIVICSNPVSHRNLENRGFPERISSNFSVPGLTLLETPDNLTIGWGDIGYVLKWWVDSNNLTVHCTYGVSLNDNLIDSGSLQPGLDEINVTVGWLGVGTHKFRLWLDWHEGNYHMGMAHEVYVTVTASLLLYVTYSAVGGSVFIFILILQKRRTLSNETNV